MRFFVHFKNMKKSDPLFAHAKFKIGDIALKFDQKINCHLDLIAEQGLHIADCKLNSKQIQLKIREDGENMYAVIDKLSDRIKNVLDRKVKKSHNYNHDKMVHHLNFSVPPADSIDAEEILANQA